MFDCHSHDRFKVTVVSRANIQIDNLPFNLALTLLAVFLMSDIRSSSSSFTSETEKLESYLCVTWIFESSETPLFLHVREKIKKFCRISWTINHINIEKKIFFHLTNNSPDNLCINQDKMKIYIHCYWSLEITYAVNNTCYIVSYKIHKFAKSRSRHCSGRRFNSAARRSYIREDIRSTLCSIILIAE